MSILDEIKKVAKEGADLSGVEAMIKDLDPLKNITTKEQALEFMGRNQVFKSALDAETSKRVENSLSKFQAEKLPEILQKEKETWSKGAEPQPWEKELSEMKKTLAEREAKLAQAELLRNLESKARELKSPLKAERYVHFGEEALKMFEEDHQLLSGTVENQVKTILKDKLGEPAYNKVTAPNTQKTMARGEFEQLSPDAKMSFVREQGVITD